MNRKIITAVFAFISTIGLCALPLEQLVNHPDKDYPLSNTIRWEGDQTPELKLLPSGFSEAGNIYARFAGFQPRITIERLYRIKLPSGLTADTSESRRRLFVRIINILGKPETQIGYTYHSSRKNRDVVLIENSYISDKRGRRIKGFHFSRENIPERFSYYQFIDDANSSGSVFEQNVLVKEKFMGYMSTNIQSVKVFIIPVMKKGGTRTEILFFPYDGYLYVYNCSQIKKEPPAKALGISINVSSMFKKRMDVMTRWISDQLSGSEQK